MTYIPGSARVGEDTPQTKPELFTKEEIIAEIKHLLRLNKRYGMHDLRSLAIIELTNYLNKS